MTVLTRALGRTHRRVGDIDPFTLRLVVFLFLSIVLIDAALLAAGWREISLRHFWHFLKFQALADSWHLMVGPFEWIKENRDGPFYEALFFASGLKTQYPLSAFLPIELLDLLGILSYRTLNIINVIAMLCVPPLTIGLLMALDRHYGVAPFRMSGWNGIVLGASISFASLVYFPAISAFTLGQIQVWINVLFVLACLLWCLRLERGTGAVIALVSLIKPQLGLLFLWAALRRRWRFCQGWLVVAVPGLIATVAVYGFENQLDYLKVLSYISQHGEGLYLNHSFNGLINRALFNGNNVFTNYYGYAPYDWRVHAVTTASSILLLALGLLWRWRARDAGGAVDFLLAATCITVASPVAWQHHYGILPPVFVIALGLCLRARSAVGQRRFGLWLGGLGLAYLLTAHQLDFLNLTSETVFNFLQSYILFGVLVLIAVLASMRAAAVDGPAETGEEGIAK